MRNIVSAFAFASLALVLTATPAFAEEVEGTSVATTAVAADDAPTSVVGEDAEPTESSDSEGSISGGVTLVNQYGFSDLFVQTEGPTVQGWISVPVAGGCSLELFASHGLETRVGRELDIGGACAFNVSENVEVNLSASRYILGGATDITTLEGQVKVGPVDAVVTQYVVDGNEPDATKFELGFTIEPTDRLSLRFVGVYEHGFGLPDIVVGGVEARYALGGNFALTANAYAPISRRAGDPREAQVFLGISFDF
jgi:hypothetical protein